MKALLGAAVIALSTVAFAAQETKLGIGVSLKEATAIKALLETPAQFVGKTIRVDGVATAVCEEMGCWMAIAPSGDPQGATVRLKVEDGVIKFPVTAKGKQVSAEGVFEAIGEKEEHANEAAGEHGRHDATASKKFQIKATGAMIK
jgi:hypothetical protein